MTTISFPSGAPPLIAILRGITPAEIEQVAEALIGAGIGAIEIPLNSPSPFETIVRLRAIVAGRAAFGAGTVTEPRQVDEVAAAGGTLIVSPHTDPAVIGRACGLGLVPLPGFMTPSEAFAALRAGARTLKLFPAETLGSGHLSALRAVLPADCTVYAVGGARPETFQTWRTAGAAGFGIGSDLYRPGRAASDVAARAAALVAAWNATN